jgi:4a-hydroxytetrahydrobiopterin dehydratase
VSQPAKPTLLTEAQIDQRLREEAPLWVRDGAVIVREIETESFLAAVALVERIAQLAERAGHHPDILIHRYRHLRLTLSTHSAGGLTAADAALAAQIDALL